MCISVHRWGSLQAVMFYIFHSHVDLTTWIMPPPHTRIHANGWDHKLIVLNFKCSGIALGEKRLLEGFSPWITDSLEHFGPYIAGFFDALKCLPRRSTHRVSLNPNLPPSLWVVWPWYASRRENGFWINFSGIETRVYTPHSPSLFIWLNAAAVNQKPWCSVAVMGRKNQHFHFFQPSSNWL